MKHHRYFDAGGREIDEQDALDRNGVLRDGRTLRVPTMMRDADPWRETDPRGRSFEATGFGSKGERGQSAGDMCTINGRDGRLRMVNGNLTCVPLRSQDARITDGRTMDPLALQRPGFRIPVVNALRAVRDAYATYETALTNAYRVNDGEKQCPDCDGEGRDDDGNVCDLCGGDGVVPSDYEDDRGAPKNFGSGNEPRDSRPLNQVMQDHRRRMDKLYADSDRELSEAWRRR